MAETVDGRRYLGGSSNVGLVVFTALSAMALTLLDTNTPETADAVFDAGLLWSDMWAECDELVKARWAEQYEELMKIAGEIADEIGAGGAL